MEVEGIRLTAMENIFNISINFLASDVHLILDWKNSIIFYVS